MALSHRARVPALSSRVAIAGAGRGIGAACARELARQGAELVLCARTAAEVEAVAREIGAQAVVADLSTDQGAAAFAEAAGAVDLALFCTGSTLPLELLEDAGAEKIKKIFFSNLAAPALAAGALVKRGAVKHLFFLSSLATRRPPIPGAGLYTVAKAALESFVRHLAEEAWPKARANALCLGPVRTRLHEEAGTPREWMETFPSPEEVVPLILRAAALPGTGRILDAEALAGDPAGALAGDGHLGQVEPLPEPSMEAEPGRTASPRVRAALRGTASGLHLYPRGAAGLAARIAGLHGSGPECVALSGGGATELLERCLRVFCSRGDEVVSPFPSFEVLSALCSREGLRHRPVATARTADGLFGPHTARPLLAAIGPRTRLVYVATPDNPTGATLAASEEEKLLSADVPLIVDEAWSFDSPRGEPRALRLRSLSKLHGLAALRIGYALGPAVWIAQLRKLELPFPLGAPQIAAAQAVLDDPERLRRSALLLGRERARLAKELRALGLAVSESPAPVLLVRDATGPGRLLFALRSANLPVQEAHWDPHTVVLPLGPRRQNERALAAVRRSVTP
jgi:histidinol-phosphate aminotransferase